MPKAKQPQQQRRSASNSTGVLDYVRCSVPRETLLELFLEPDRGRFVCRAILQQLSGVAQQIVVRLSCTGGQFPVSGVQVWTNTSPAMFSAMLQDLHDWGILTKEGSTVAAGAVVVMTDRFRQGLQAALLHLDASPWTALQPEQLQAMRQEAGETTTASAVEQVTPEFLERYTQTKWDSVLHFLVGTVGYQEPPGAVVHFLLTTGLMQPDPDDSVSAVEDAALVITQNGYDFMLQDNHQQVWHFVVQYLKSLETLKKGEGLCREALLLLICLSFARVGEAYLANSLNKESRVMVKDLANFGLLYTIKIGKATVFYPTRVAMMLVGNDDSNDGGSSASTLWSLSSKALDSALAHPRPHDSSHLAVLVQTNFQICAYTTSELHVSMLGLFCDLHTIRRLPNAVFMFITRDSVKTAFALGIQARQILRFLEKHSHPRLRTASNVNAESSTNSPIPSNVVDQIWLWDRERTRVALKEVYQHQCLMEGEFQAVINFTKNLGAHAWSSERRRSVLVDYEYVERVQKYVRQWRAKAVARQQQRG